MAENDRTTNPGANVGRGTSRAYRMKMWGFLFFLPVINAYLEAVGWLVLLLSPTVPDEGRSGRLRPRGVAVAGLVISVGRIVVIIGRGGTMGFGDATLRSISLLLAAVFLWQVCRPIISLGEQAGNHVLQGQARLRCLAYAVYAVLPVAFSAVSRELTSGEALVVLGGYLVVGTAVTTLVLALLSNAASLARAVAVAPPRVPAG